MTFRSTLLLASFCFTAGGTSVERRQSNLQNSGALPRRPHDINGAISAVLLALFLAGAATALADDLYLNLAQATRATCGWGTARNDASVAGQPLRVGTAEFENDVGTHAPAELIYRLDGKYRWLTFVRREKLALNESTLWSGAPSDSNLNPAGLQHFPEIRRLLFAGQYNEARALCIHGAEINNHQAEILLVPAPPKQSARSMRPLWRDLILKVWGADPLQCPCCKAPKLR